MLVYLDNAQSRAGALNENHARELMELFTLGTGVGGGIVLVPVDRLLQLVAQPLLGLVAEDGLLEAGPDALRFALAGATGALGHGGFGQSSRTR